MTRERVIQNITQSLDDFMKNDGYLIEHDVSERAITHKLAQAFEAVFRQHSGYDVDCDYNRCVGLDPIKRGNTGRRVYPDIIVHRRGKRNDNLLAVEVKKTKAERKAIQKDEKKARSVRPRSATLQVRRLSAFPRRHKIGLPMDALRWRGMHRVAGPRIVDRSQEHHTRPKIVEFRPQLSLSRRRESRLFAGLGGALPMIF